MSNFIEKFYQFVDKIGKQNFILMFFILFIILLTGLYQTFSLFTSSEGMDIVDGIKTYKFVLNGDNSDNIITIPANNSRNLKVTISNSEDISLKYGIYYNSTNDLSLVSLGYLIYSEYLPNGLIESKDSYDISLKINNKSDHDISINIGVVYGLENGGDLLLNTNSHWFSLYYSSLSDMSVGSYVKYVGNNGCIGKSCEGENANYVSDDDMGYCNSSLQKFKVNGWRIAYIEDDSVYLVSAGAPECVCTGVDGSLGDKCDGYDTTIGVQQHIDNLNEVALKYCNNTYVDGGVCNNDNTWNFNDIDFKKISGYSLRDKFNKDGDYSSNDLINNGSAYWFSTAKEMDLSYFWSQKSNVIDVSRSDSAFGIRPVIKLKSSIVVIGGNGTYHEPYVIK